MVPGRDVFRPLAWLRGGPSRPILLFALVTLGVAGGPSVTTAAQLNLTWVDNSGGQAGFIIQRAQSITGTYTQIAQNPPGVTSYTDAAVSAGTTYCYQVAASNGAETSSFSNPACASPSGGFALTVVKAGPAVGTVGSSPAGINCGTVCSATYPSSTAVTLTATPSSDSIFIGWSGGGCSGTDACTMVGNVPMTVTATFDSVRGTTMARTDPGGTGPSSSTYTLTVRTKGPGIVSSGWGGTSCGSVCPIKYARGSVITLTAAPERGAQVNGWDGGRCRGTGTCTVTLNTAISVTASFSKNGKK